MNSASPSDNEETPGRPTRVSIRSCTRRIRMQPPSPTTGAEPDDDTTSTGGADFAIAETSAENTPERPPCPDEHYPGSLGPICSVPCAVKDFTADPTPEEQRLHHQQMQRNVANRLASSPGPFHLPRPSHSHFLGPTRWVKTVRSVHSTHVPSSHLPDLETSDPHLLSKTERSVRSRSPLPCLLYTSPSPRD